MLEMSGRSLGCLTAVALACALTVACGDDEADEGVDSGASTGGAGGSGGADAGVPEPEAGPPGEFTGDCSSSKWANVSDACWSCLCGACTDQLNACNGPCMETFACGNDESCLVDQGAQITCEVSCFAQRCLMTTERQMAAQALIAFDGCLIGGGSGENFRICEEECGLAYSGDVCDRFPAGM